ncbi:hypothetical protein ASPWEDRAFT_37576 [Aspergillus wentii DTO 134E9]|uniref:EKC/KEOPS complex subunit BUD32 n=1 Tax=Aspergillus wentii DTO 134E9 TaxID=1073089 RepID=A0A1L9RY12_ASPWE|nr:uncharacterized protein ASPWEDRAFT_37576 [Aspergillus wentii DTO 134E9]KAI9931592.1 hypothetical protein MW887_010169 [Aspergillus wentii]OJJ39737.1 hypothetical protein ASPWEDRAFT_37576 [Aspergillus wentii DTO 134E9]
MSEKNTEDFPAESPGFDLQLHDDPEDLEKVWDYEPGGHHPVHLGDRLGEGKYKVIHKLGNGGFGNVWLCQILDPTPKYVALKILMADLSGDDCKELKVNKLAEKIDNDSICLPLDQFKVKGPNGDHWCFVYPLAGPMISSAIRTFEGDERILRRLALRTVKTLAALHDIGVCHGDFTPHNVLLRMTGLDGLSEEEVIKILHKPVTADVTTYSGKPLPESAARYLVYPISFISVDRQYFTDQIYIIDFGESFNESDPPDKLGTPKSYCSPELLLGEKPSIASDLWALGCTLYGIRTGEKLFNMFDDEADEYIYYMVLMLGVLPEPWWSTTWKDRRKWFKDEPDSEGRAVQVPDLNDKMAIEDRLGGGDVLRELPDGRLVQAWDPGLPEEEKKIFIDLLRKLFRFKPEERLSTKEVQEHEWFKLGI